MSRPRIPIGTFGEVTFINRPHKRLEAGSRYRDWDGQTPHHPSTASPGPGAEIALKKNLAERTAFQPVDTTLTPDSPFGALIDYWPADLDLEARIAPSPRRHYEAGARKLVLPAFVLAVRREVLMRNPIDSMSRLHKVRRTPTALIAAEINAIRAVIKWGSGPVVPGDRITTWAHQGFREFASQVRGAEPRRWLNTRENAAGLA